MAKRDANALREQAKKLLEKARQIEEARALRIGKLIMRYREKNYEGFVIDRFKKEIEETINKF